MSLRTRIQRSPILTGVILGLSVSWWFAGAAEAQDPLLAPYPIEGVWLEARRSDGAGGFPHVVVGLDRAREPGEGPERQGSTAAALEAPTWITVVGSDGWLVASLVEVERRCHFLCGIEDGEECHWVGRYAPRAPLETAGAPLGAFPGRLELSGFTSLAADDEPDAMAHLAEGSDPSPLAWNQPPDWRPTYGVDAWAPGGELRLTVTDPGGTRRTIEDEACEARGFEWLLTLRCRGLHAVASGGKLLLLSWPDYNLASAEPVARFEYGGSRHYLLRLGLKAQDVPALLSAEPAGWRARVRPRTWALLC